MSLLADVARAFDAAVWRGETGALAALTAAAPAHDARIRVHQNNTFVSLIEALGDLYPRVRRFVGNEFFDQTARAYLRAQQPRSPAMVRFGATFPAFLEHLDALAAYPFVADVAKAEFAWHEAYHAADATPLDPAALAALDAGAWERTALKLHPSARLVASLHALDTLWELSAEDAAADAPAEIPDRAARLLIVRPYAEVEVRILAPEAFALLQAVSEGASVLAACERAQDAAPDADIPSVLRDLIHGGTFAALQTIGTKS